MKDYTYTWIIAQVTQGGGLSLKDVGAILGWIFAGMATVLVGLATVYFKFVRKSGPGMDGRPFIIKAIVTELPEAAQQQLDNHEKRLERSEEEVASLGKELRDGLEGMRTAIGSVKSRVDDVKHAMTRRQDRSNFILIQLARKNGIDVPPLEEDVH